VRLAQALDLTLDELVTINDQTPPRPSAAPAGDDSVVLALVASYGRLTIATVLDLLRWSHERLDAAVASLTEHLAPTPIRLAVTDQDLMLTVRPGAPPTLTRDRVDHDRNRRRPLTPPGAVAVIRLVRDKILNPFPGDDDARPLRHSDIDHLVSTGLAVPAPEPAEGQPASGGVEIHPDVMFALRLIDRPALDDDRPPTS
jgi:hypothetical protein